jgi:hypothetical protein
LTGFAPVPRALVLPLRRESMRAVRRISLFLSLLVLLVIPHSPGLAQGLPGEPEVILLRADPEVIAADGQSSATLLAEVRDRQGAFVVDGTIVRFTTTAGVINPSVETRSGVVRVTLRSSAEPAVAEVTATAGTRAMARVRVTFSTEAIGAQQVAPFARIQAQSLQYLPDKDLIDAAGDVRLTYRGVFIIADRLQLDVASLRVVAQNHILLRCAGQEVTADRLMLEMPQMQGRLLAVEENGTIRRQVISGYALDLFTAEGATPEGIFDLRDPETDKAVISARKITLFPGDKVQFSGFGLRVAGAHLISLPFYVLSLNPYGPDADHLVSLDSMGGISVNLPFYYSVTDTSNGSLRLRRQTRYGYDGYVTRPGWHLALDQRYSFGRGTHGAVELNHITSSDWGIRWRHEQQFGDRTHTYVSVDSPAHRDLYARTELHHSMGLGDLSWSAYGSFLPQTPGSVQSRLYFRLRPGVIKGPNIRYYWSTNVAWNKWGDESYLEEGVDLQLHPPALRLGQTTSLQFYIGSGFTFSPNGTGPNAQASTTLLKRLGKNATATLRYSYYYSGRTTDYYGPTSGQSLTGQLMAASGNRWSTSLTATVLPTRGDLSVYGSLVYSPLRNWRVELRPTYSRYGGDLLAGYPRSTTNLDVYLVRQFGSRDVALRYSTLDDAIRLELAATALRF